MRTHRPLVLGAAIAIAVAMTTMISAPGQTAPWEPKTYSIDRYEKAWERNPFNLKTAVAEKPTADFAKDLVVAGVATLGDMRRVWLQNTRTKEYIRIGDGIENDQSIELIDLVKDPNPKNVVVRVSNGMMEAEVKYDEASLSAGAPNGDRPKETTDAKAETQGGAQPRRRILLPGEGKSAQRIRLPSARSETSGDGENTGPSNVTPASGNAADRRQRIVPEQEERED